ncbi:MAG TPA: ISAzo13 family transposase [Gemmataceae bacterium]|jgi:transposase|nr:ISAzo13 family transposase [Gemmataceae bacterium]
MSTLRSRHGRNQQRHETDRPDEHDQQYRQELKAFLATLSHEQRRLYAAIESNHLGRGGVASVAKVTGLCKPTIARGRRELKDLLQGKPLQNRRKPGPGRPRTEQTYPAITAALEELLSDEVAGSPEGEQKWVRSSVAKLTQRLREQGFQVGHNAVWALLKRMGFSLRTAVRKRRGVSRDPASRDEQFRYIAARQKAFAVAGLPAISVDTKKKELIGNFRNPGRLWCRQPPEVDEHSFPSQAEGVAVPFGVYDLGKNRGYVAVGTSHNTPEFAVSVIARWWEEEGQVCYPRKRHLLILADGGGANGRRSAAWRLNLQEKVCDRFRLTVTVCHYPPGCSKWNPVERRLFSEISKNWEGRPLRSFSIMLGYIRGTTTTTGLTVKAYLDDGIYKKGQKVTREDVRGLALERHSVCSDWNYTIRPRKNGANHA